MPTIPIRGVGGVGVVTDINPQDAPELSWTDARNVRFADGVMSRYSVFRIADIGYSYSKTPVGVMNGEVAGTGGLITVFSDGTMESNQNGAITDVSPVGTLGSSLQQITSCYLGNVAYMNREAYVPVYRSLNTTGVFTAIPGWATTDRCKSLRAFKDFLIALNVSKGGLNYPAMIKWSDAAQVGAPPSTWSTTDPASLAGESVLNDINGPIIDGAALSDSFFIYGTDQVFRMDYVGTPFIFKVQKVFDDQGAMAKNCIVEADGKHFVFGKSDIYAHDGLTKVSIVNSVVSRRIFGEIDFTVYDRCFVYHDKVFGEVGFCYPSSDDQAAWPIGDTAGCNRAAVFNYRFQTWTFVDLPNVTGATEAQLTRESTWEDFDGPWSLANETWLSFSGLKPKHLLLASTGNTALSIPAQPYFLDPMVDGRLSNDVDENVLWPAFAISEARDLDDLGSGLMGRKVITRLYPQFRTRTGDSRLIFTVGSSRNPSDSITWSRPKEFLNYDSPRYDTRTSGRYLSVRLDVPAGSHLDFSGYDLDLELLSGR